MPSSISIPSVDQVFVYGTLQRGQIRGSRWPASPVAVHRAWTLGLLFDRTDYPAMLPGTDRVAGELWQFAPADMPDVLRTLDRIEGAGQPGEPDLYRRVTVAVFSLQNDPLGDAFTYLYARSPIEDGFIRLSPAEPGRAIRWPTNRELE